MNFVDWNPLLDLFAGTPDVIVSAVKVAVLIVGGLLLAVVARFTVSRVVARSLTPERTTLVGRVVFWGIVGVTLADALTQLGFDLSVLLGAAGLLTVALGFASQTSASNVISGLFLIGEQPFSVGDWITIGNTTGEVIAVDFLSVKLRTGANLYVRVPNETVMKTEIINLTRFPIRRIDIRVGVAYKEDVERVRDALVAMVDDDPMFLDEPRPAVRFVGYGESGVDLDLLVWTSRTHFLDAKDHLGWRVKRTLDDAGVEIPFPHRTLYAGAVTAPFPVQVVPPEGDQGGGTAGPDRERGELRSRGTVGEEET